jgi:hypothetical protein
VAGPRGPTGAQGPAGSFKVFPFVGAIGNLPASPDFRFVGPITTLDLTAPTNVIGSGSAVLGTTNATALQADMQWCYRPVGGFITLFGTYLTFDVGQQRLTYAASAAVNLAAGTYDVGLCLRSSFGDLNRNDWTLGWVLLG